MTRLDITYANSQLAQFMYNLLDDYYLAANRVIRYLNSTSTYILEFRSIPKTIVYMFEGSSNTLFTNLKRQKNLEGYYF
jgi:hypothetical protein